VVKAFPLLVVTCQVSKSKNVSYGPFFALELAEQDRVIVRLSSASEVDWPLARMEGSH
jgi:hypothetical protein